MKYGRRKSRFVAQAIMILTALTTPTTFIKNKMRLHISINHILESSSDVQNMLRNLLIFFHNSFFCKEILTFSTCFLLEKLVDNFPDKPSFSWWQRQILTVSEMSTQSSVQQILLVFQLYRRFERCLHVGRMGSPPPPHPHKEIHTHSHTRAINSAQSTANPFQQDKHSYRHELSDLFILSFHHFS